MLCETRWLIKTKREKTPLKTAYSVLRHSLLISVVTLGDWHVSGYIQVSSSSYIRVCMCSSMCPFRPGPRNSGRIYRRGIWMRDTDVTRIFRDLIDENGLAIVWYLCTLYFTIERIAETLQSNFSVSLKVPRTNLKS